MLLLGVWDSGVSGLHVDDVDCYFPGFHTRHMVTSYHIILDYIVNGNVSMRRNTPRKNKKSQDTRLIFHASLKH